MNVFLTRACPQRRVFPVCLHSRCLPARNQYVGQIAPSREPPGGCAGPGIILVAQRGVWTHIFHIRAGTYMYGGAMGVQCTVLSSIKT